MSFQTSFAEPKILLVTVTRTQAKISKDGKIDKNGKASYEFNYLI